MALNSTLTAATSTVGGGANAHFMSLPRELRDHVYEELVVTSQPIRFDQLFGPLAYGVEGLNLLYGWDILRQITQEACEIFYQRNIFEVFCDDLPLLLGANIHQWALHEYPDCRDWLKDSLPHYFDTKLHVMNLKIPVPEHRRSARLADDLGCLLCCDRPQNVTLEFRWTTWQGLDDDSKLVLERLQRKLGDRLDVHVEGIPRDRGIEYYD